MIEVKTIQDFFVVLMAILGFLSVVGGVINLFKGWRKDALSTKNAEIIKDHEKRIRELEKKQNDQNAFIQVLCRSVSAMISHQLNGDSHDQLEKAQEELNNFLINRS